MHDRFIVLDYGEADERIFHCGASSKDAAVKLTTAISELMSEDMKAHMHELIDKMKGNPAPGVHSRSTLGQVRDYYRIKSHGLTAPFLELNTKMTDDRRAIG